MPSGYGGFCNAVGERVKILAYVYAKSVAEKDFLEVGVVCLSMTLLAMNEKTGVIYEPINPWSSWRNRSRELNGRHRDRPRGGNGPIPASVIMPSCMTKGGSLSSWPLHGHGRICRPRARIKKRVHQEEANL